MLYASLVISYATSVHPHMIFTLLIASSLELWQTLQLEWLGKNTFSHWLGYYYSNCSSFSLNTILKLLPIKKTHIPILTSPTISRTLDHLLPHLILFSISSSKNTFEIHKQPSHPNHHFESEPTPGYTAVTVYKKGIYVTHIHT